MTIRLVLWKAEKAVERIDLQSIADTRLCASDFAILEALLHKGPLMIGQIGEKVLLTSGSMTAAINRLVRNGYVKRIKKIEDARCWDVALTRKGRKIIEAAYPRPVEQGLALKRSEAHCGNTDPKVARKAKGLWPDQGA